ncbi:MAG TPA: hypothetical protein VMG13_03405 [Trebonia sp.]|nr:hypothetical protein [Trebonia sp.]
MTFNPKDFELSFAPETMFVETRAEKELRELKEVGAKLSKQCLRLKDQLEGSSASMTQSQFKATMKGTFDEYQRSVKELGETNGKIKELQKEVVSSSIVRSKFDLADGSTGFSGDPRGTDPSITNSGDVRSGRDSIGGGSSENGGSVERSSTDGNDIEGSSTIGTGGDKKSSRGSRG